MKSILFVSDAPISNHLTGSLVSEQVYGCLKEEDIFFLFTPGHEMLASGIASRDCVEPDMTLVKMRERVPIRWGPVMAWAFAILLTMGIEIIGRLKWFVPIVNLKKRKFNWCWLILQGQNSLVLFDLIHRIIGIPMVVQVWDHMDWWTTSNHFPSIFRWYFRKRFEGVLRRASYVVCPSPAFAEKVKTEFGVPAQHLIFALDDDLFGQFTVEPSRAWIVGFAGQVYAQEEFDLLISALESMNWVHQGKPVRMRLIGRGLEGWANRLGDRAEWSDWLHQRELERELSKCDLLYCPYPFSPSVRRVVESSFPSKLVNYLATGRPVLFHGPEYSSPWQWMRGKSFARLSQSRTVSDLSLDIERFLRSGISAREAQEQTSFARHEFSLIRFRERMKHIKEYVGGMETAT